MRIEDMTLEQAYDPGHKDRNEIMQNYTLSRRDHFAMAAMQGILSGSRIINGKDAIGEVDIAEASTCFADALIVELDGGEG